MSHEIDTNADGTSNAVYNLRPGWHGLGQVHNDPAVRLDLGLALKMGNLADWNVRKVPFWAEDTNGDIITADQYALTVRNHPTDPNAPAQPLGVVSMKDYRVIQNEDAFAFGQNLLDAGLEVETAGSLRGGRQVFMLYRIPKTINVGGDEVYPFLLVTTSHDKSLALQVTLTGIRVECANMMSMALNQPTPRYTCRHMGEGLEGKIADARLALGVAYQGMDAFQQQMTRWLDRDVTAKEFDKIILANFPKPNDDVHPLAVANWENTTTAVRALYEVAPTNARIKGTAWGAAQALLEWHDWTKGTDDSRAKRQVSHDAEMWRRRAFAKTGKVLNLI